LRLGMGHHDADLPRGSTLGHDAGSGRGGDRRTRRGRVRSVLLPRFPARDRDRYRHRGRARRPGSWRRHGLGTGVTMKLFTAIIKPFKVDEVTHALHALGVPGATLTEVRGFGRQRGHSEVYRGAEYHVDYIPKVRLDIIVDDSLADAVVKTVS